MLMMKLFKKEFGVHQKALSFKKKYFPNSWPSSLSIGITQRLKRLSGNLELLVIT